MKQREKELRSFMDGQLRVWDEARERFRLLGNVKTRNIHFDGTQARLQYNPARMLSTKADIEKILVGDRPCFLCKKNRPEVQTSLPFASDFEILVNPYPILPEHYTIASIRHQPQQALAPLPHAGNAVAAIMELAAHYPHLTAIYNGPRAGASAPDHLHLQAGIGKQLPLISRWEELKPRLHPLLEWRTTHEWKHKSGHKPHYAARIFRIEGHCSNGFAMTHTDADAAVRLFKLLYKAMKKAHGDEQEPPFNLVAWQHDGEPWLTIFPRKRHRPACFYAEGEARRLISPGALDMAGQITVPRQEDFAALTSEEVRQIYRDVCASDNHMRRIASIMRRMHSPVVSVGLMQDKQIDVRLDGNYRCKDMRCSGEQCIGLRGGKLLWNGKTYDKLSFTPLACSSTITLKDVVIGKQFHWQRTMPLSFEGSLRLTPQPDGSVCVVNRIGVESYLAGVISSEMGADAPIELLKAHAVISRSWIMRILSGEDKASDQTLCQTDSPTSTLQTIIRWYDNHGHRHFDVCADDHCQRYQGVERLTNPNVEKAIEATRGLVLTCEGEICDARYSKCCGGKTEDYAVAWEDKAVPYLQSISDCDKDGRPFCHCGGAELVEGFLNDFDRQTDDYFSWSEELTQAELSHLVSSHIGRDVGSIIALVPVKRGPGGHIAMLKVVATKEEIVIGKELEIRKMLSGSHLKSSNFSVEYHYADGTSSLSPTVEVPTSIVLHGKGWGHGVGLCQIGAAMMAHQGYGFEDILAHYYPNTNLEQLYP